MTKARSWILPAVGVAVAVVVVVAGMLALTHDRQRKAGAPAAGVSASAQAHQVAQALASLAADPQSLVASRSAGQVNGNAQQAVPRGSTVVVDEKSWAPDGLGGGTIAVTVTAPGKPPATYATVMVAEGGKWKVLATFPLTTTASRSPAASSP